MPKITKLSELFGLVAWSSVFVESWLLLLRNLPIDALSITFFIFFFLIGITTASVGYKPSEPKKYRPIPGFCECPVKKVVMDHDTNAPICKLCGKVRLD